MSEKITKTMIKIAKATKAIYTFRDRELDYGEVFSTAGLFAGMVKRADSLSQLCMGYGLNVSFDTTQQSVLGFKVDFKGDHLNGIEMAFLFDVMEELRKGSISGKVSLNDLLYERVEE